MSAKLWAVTLILLTLHFTNFIMCDYDYLEERNKLLVEEHRVAIGGNITLSEKEESVSKILKSLKVEELERAYADSSKFIPNLSFYQARRVLEDSNVFRIIQILPKGASLHTHLLAAVSVDFLMDNVTYRDNLYGSFVNGVFKLQFFAKANPPWKLLAQYRLENIAFHDWLRSKLSIKDSDTAPEDLWKKFKNIFSTVYDMLCFRPVFQDYVYQALLELYEDNVMHAEFKGTFMPLYELNGTTYNTREFFQIFTEVVAKFKRDYPKFLGARYIHSVYRGVDNDKLKSNLNELLEMKKYYPGFIVGFDLVGFEDETKLMVDMHEVLMKYRTQLKFFAHAGETNWYGHTDQNLADAILLNASRIGHALALPKHPTLLKLARDRNIPVEVCPISNKILSGVEDLRNHPATYLMATNYPVVVCNDDPSVWNATGLSYDWYMVFMAMTSKDNGLESLKQLAINSIAYSSMEEVQKNVAMARWREQWDEFLDEVLLRFKKYDRIHLVKC